MGSFMGLLVCLSGSPQNPKEVLFTQDYQRFISFLLLLHTGVFVRKHAEYCSPPGGMARAQPKLSKNLLSCSYLRNSWIQEFKRCPQVSSNPLAMSLSLLAFTPSSIATNNSLTSTQLSFMKNKPRHQRKEDSGPEHQAHETLWQDRD